MGINTFQNIAETCKLVQLYGPVSFSGAVNSLFVNTTKYAHLSLLVSIGTQAAATTITVTNSTDSAGAGETAIGFDYFLTSQATTQASAADLMGARTTVSASGVATDGATTGVIYAIEIPVISLTPTYSWVRVKFSSPGAAVLGSVVAVLTTARYAGAPANMPTALA